MKQEIIRKDIADYFDHSIKDLFQDCLLISPKKCIDKVKFSTPPSPRPREGYRVYLNDSNLQGHIHILLGSGGGVVRIDTAGHINIDIRMFRKSSVSIGKGTTISSARIVCDNSDVTIGEDGLWSDEILVQSNDQHGIIDLKTKKIINESRRSIEIGDHVWIGRRTTIMPDVKVGKGAILGTGAILTSNIPDSMVFAGVPARKIREDVTWSRSPNGFSREEQTMFGS